MRGQTIFVSQIDNLLAQAAVSLPWVKRISPIRLGTLASLGAWRFLTSLTESLPDTVPPQQHAQSESLHSRPDPQWCG